MAKYKNEDIDPGDINQMIRYWRKKHECESATPKELMAFAEREFPEVDWSGVHPMNWIDYSLRTGA